LADHRALAVELFAREQLGLSPFCRPVFGDVPLDRRTGLLGNWPTGINGYLHGPASAVLQVQ